ncbi:MAG: toxin-antitoxin system HicB family antitoxin, partial [Acidimicrobiia bacterium]|nr:toxin-antitoxin system HicB family antitoxin [Acidimicrobiia bacterium]
SARITLRLPDSLKDDLESAAGDSGDSVNAYVIKALSSRAGRRSARRITETFET